MMVTLIALIMLVSFALRVLPFYLNSCNLFFPINKTFCNDGANPGRNTNFRWNLYRVSKKEATVKM